METLTRLISMGLLAASAVAALLLAPPALGCTSVLVTRGASADGSTLVSYSADSHKRYGDLRLTPARHHPEGAMRDIHDWGSGKFLGRIKEAPTTYKVVGNMNEHQLAIAESTFGGRKELEGPAGIIDYGSLIYIALERARSAREAIRVMTELVTEYGYASTGESFSIVDPKEAWLMEMIGKGAGQKGAVWVARRVPDGHLSVHANQARIRQFPLDAPDSTLYSPDVISFAREKGWFKGLPRDFSFADVYAPFDFEAVRFCEARVWSVFRRAAPSAKLSLEYASGHSPDKRLPLWIKPDRKLTVQDTMALMRDHYEGTELDMTKGVGAGPFGCPYRWRPMTWEVDGRKYLHERAISTQQTGFSFVAQVRSWLPGPIGGVLWFGVDDTYTTVYTPMYAGLHEVPRPYAAGVASRHEFSWDSAFWVFNWVSNQAYARWRDIIVDVQGVQRELEGQFLAEQPEIDRAALELYRRTPEQARAYLTDYSVRQGERVVARWRKLGEQLLVKYLDGNLKTEMGEVTHPPYHEDWYQQIVHDEGERLRVPASQVEATTSPDAGTTPPPPAPPSGEPVAAPPRR